MAEPLSCFFSFIMLVLILQASTISAQMSGKINVGTSLTATINGSSWLSPAGDFAFGFHQYLNHTDLFLLAIWYAKIPDTIVWHAVDANQGNPVPRGSRVTLTTNDGLVLTDPHGTRLWNTSTGSSTVHYGFMNDTGNLMLMRISNKTDNPTDTLLPSQTLQRHGVVDSRLSETNFSRGKYQLRLQDDGNLVLNFIDLATNLNYVPPTMRLALMKLQLKATK